MLRVLLGRAENEERPGSVGEQPLPVRKTNGNRNRLTIKRHKWGYSGIRKRNRMNEVRLGSIRKYDLGEGRFE